MKRITSVHVCKRRLLGRLALVVLVAGTLAACASTRPVKFTIHSDPPGGYVMMKLQGSTNGTSDWIYLGNTPLVTIREMDISKIKSVHAVSLKVMRQGYFDQTKEWGGKPFVKEHKEKGLIYWNPRLVPGGR